MTFKRFVKNDTILANLQQFSKLPFLQFLQREMRKIEKKKLPFC